jgi:hypothetical protein
MDHYKKMRLLCGKPLSDDTLASLPSLMEAFRLGPDRPSYPKAEEMNQAARNLLMPLSNTCH